jgi:hypothetical protein
LHETDQPELPDRLVLFADLIDRFESETALQQLPDDFGLAGLQQLVEARGIARLRESGVKTKTQLGQPFIRRNRLRRQRQRGQHTVDQAERRAVLARGMEVEQLIELVDQLTARDHHSAAGR